MKPSSHPRLFLLAALVGINFLLFALTGYALFKNQQQYELRAEALTQNIASAVDQNVSGMIDRIDLALAAVVKDAERQLVGGRIDEGAMNDLLTWYLQHVPEVAGFRLTNADGIIIIGSNVSDGRKSNVSDRDYFLFHRDNPDGKPGVSKPLFGRITDRDIIVFSQRYNHPDGRFAGVIFATVPLDHFDKMLARFNLGPKDTIVLRDEDYGQIARHPSLERESAKAGSKAVSDEYRRLMESGVRWATYRAMIPSDGIERTLSLHRLEKAPMVVIVGLSSREYMAGWFKELFQTVILDLGFLLMSLVMGGFLLKFFSELVESRYLFQSIIDTAPMRVFWKDRTLRYLGCSPAFALDAGKAGPEEVVGEDDYHLGWAEQAESFRADDRSVIETGISKLYYEERLSIADGRSIWIRTTKLPLRNSDGNIIGVLGLYEDITDIKAAEDEIKTLAFYDPLTGLANRRLLMDRLRQAIAAGRRSEKMRALLFIDLDHIKTLNDTLGHEMGDLLLQNVAHRLSACIREVDTAARLGGDEFIVILEDLSGESEHAAAHAETVGEKILAAIARPYVLFGHEYRSTASIGITLFGDQRESVDELITEADIAMYQAKAAGRNTLRFFSPQLQAVIKARASLEEDLRQALKTGQFLLYYQPQMDQGRLVGAEALLRWHHPKRGMVSPGEFIPLAEETGLILPLGDWVLETACRQIASWAADGQMAGISVAVNVSARQFRQENFTDRVLTTLDRSGADPQKLKLELTESMLVDNIEDVIAKMSELKARGLTFSLDDFGTGYSSLSYLKRLPLDQLKIDQSFVCDVLTDQNDAIIAKTVMALARSLGLSVIAEGVETEAQKDFLASAGCLAYQGYLFSRPLPVADFERFAWQNTE